jgi:hypothetical protein
VCEDAQAMSTLLDNPFKTLSTHTHTQMDNITLNSTTLYTYIYINSKLKL